MSMDETQRKAVLDNARYLRNIRPVDPAEIHEYVHGRPHPAVVREVLREERVQLGLREREDGTFVPVVDGPLDVSFDGVDAFPDRYVRAVEDLLVDTYGSGYPDGETGDRLRQRIREIKERYYRNKSVRYDHDTALGYTVYHQPAYYATTMYVLADLTRFESLPRQLRVLDVGAGTGGPMLGVHDLTDTDEKALVEYHAVEPSDPNLAVLEDLSEQTRESFLVETHRTTAETFTPDTYDLVLFSNVLSELDDPVAVVGRYLDAVDPAGSLVAVAPADRETATELREIERTVEREHGTTVWGPDVRLWPGEQPTDQGWSFTVQPGLDVPAFQRRLDEGVRERDPAGPDPATGEFLNTDVQYAHFVLRPDGSRRINFEPDSERVLPFTETNEAVSERIDCVAIKLSHDLRDAPDANPVYKMSDGSENVGHFAVLTRESALNEDLARAAYGDLLAFENVLVLWNDDEEAYNLVVDAETVVDRVAP